MFEARTRTRYGVPRVSSVMVVVVLVDGPSANVVQVVPLVDVWMV